MGKTDRRETRKARHAVETSPQMPSFDPLPPPRPNKALLTISLVLTAAWIGFLLFLVLRQR